MRYGLALVVAFTGVTSGCGTDEPNASSSTSATTIVASTNTSGTQIEPRPTRVGTSGGITIRLLKVREAKTISYEGGTQDSSVTPDARPRTKRAPQGGRYVYVTTRVENDAGEGIDITCGAPTTVALVDTDSNKYDPVDGLYLIRGNPACNSKLQPGFKIRMTWVFLLPRGAELDSFAFADTTDLGSSADPAQIVIPRS